jgi:hypothetical protein
VALDAAGARVLIGARGEPVGANPAGGAAYAFTRNGDRWAQQARITGGGAAVFFGSAVALDRAGATAVIGDEGDSDDTGAAYVSAPLGSWTSGAGASYS